ncbi:MAG: transposase [Planctomycetes bacterium]|nr:transposase [Planctomycetota bacterium]
MPRVARIVVPGLAHHITQRGNNRQDVFFINDDRRAYLRILTQQAQRYGLSVLSYCLMKNHVHLIVTPERSDSLALAIGRTHWLYARYINRLHRRSGHLWQNRFFSFAMDADHLLRAARYVERNPVRARLVRLPWRYQWSSAAAHCGQPDRSGVLDLTAWRTFVRRRAWLGILQQPEDDSLVLRIRRQTKTGRPLASDAFLAKLERRLGRRLRAEPLGRPPKPAVVRPKRKRTKVSTP